MLVKEAESVFQKKLESYFTSIFSETNIPSHDLSHHRRVWYYAKELLSSLNTYGIAFGDNFPEKLIIGCYLHDSGMSVDSGLKHGHHSALLCKKFLETNNLDVGSFSDLLSAIENHDNKEYTNKGKPDDLLTILSVSDDLDAFGVVGVYRYSEIYLKRARKLKELGFLILVNIASRFSNFSRTFSFDEELVTRHKERYQVVEDFFNDYNILTEKHIFGSDNISGNCGIIELIAQSVENENHSINRLVMNGIKSKNHEVRKFYNELAYKDLNYLIKKSKRGSSPR